MRKLADKNYTHICCYVYAKSHRYKDAYFVAYDNAHSRRWNLRHARKIVSSLDDVSVVLRCYCVIASEY